MNRFQAQRLFSVISGLWVGAFIAIGFLAVPTLFATIGDRQVAAMIAASLFKVTALIGIGVACLLILVANHFVRLRIEFYRLIRLILLLMLACALVAAFILIPWMNAIRDQALQLGLSVQDTSSASLFRSLHSVSSMIFLIQTILGLILVWQSTKNVD